MSVDACNPIAFSGELCDFSTSFPPSFSMHKPQITRISHAVLYALPLTAGAQQGLQLKFQPTLILMPSSINEDVPLFLDADRVQGHSDLETEAEGEVRLRKRGQAVHADRLRYDKPADEVSA